MEVPTRIETDRLILRKPEAGDWHALNEAINETFDELRKWMGWAQTTSTMENAENSVMNAISRWECGEEFRIFMIEKSTGKFIGSTGFIRRDLSVPKYEIGYWCRKTMSGNGFVTEAVSALTDMALNTLGARRVEIKCDRDNAKSAAVAERLGYTFEGMHVNDAVKVDGSGLRSTKVYART